MIVFNYLVVILISASLGSFIGALTYRLPRGLGFVKGNSFCDNCKKPLGWINNIPLFSYLFQRGLASCCGKPVSARYFLIEISAAVAAVYIYASFSLVTSIIYFLVFLVCLAIFVIDFENQFIPDELTFVILFLGIMLSPTPFFEKMFFALATSLPILAIHLLTFGRGMGLGDVKLTVALAVWLPFFKLPYFMFGAFLTGGIVAAILLLARKAKLSQKIAFGPFIIISFLYNLLFT